ncbi:MAG TPA: histidinol dehydrogenase [Bacteroidota bacterium]|nr:histidinol dehydrogenase [Bacteroidota bacterium]
MLRQIDARALRSFTHIVPKNPPSASKKVERLVSAIIRRVQQDGDDAVRYYTKKFDGSTAQNLSVPHKEIESALAHADPEFLRLLNAAAKNIRRFHNRQRQASWTIREGNNSFLRQMYRPVDRVGLYIPGGKAAYPSTVLMNAIPAQVAGVKEIILVSPPDNQGRIHPDVLVAAAVLGVRKIFRVGGAQAIAALAYGTKTIPAVDVIVGPGNIFVATAKRLVYGKVGIDGIAGPSEVVILADDTANAEFVAADMLAQAEHDEFASSMLVTTSAALARDVRQSLKKIAAGLSRKSILAASLKNRGAIFLVKNLDEAATLVNELAPEHLEIVTRNDEATLKKIKHAGSIFLGSYSPVVVGDYFAGPNHVLPTDRTARFASPLSVDNFMKKSSVVRYSKARMESVSEKVAAFAEREGLTAHALSARLRMRKRKP